LLEGGVRRGHRRTGLLRRDFAVAPKPPGPHRSTVHTSRSLKQSKKSHLDTVALRWVEIAGKIECRTVDNEVKSGPRKTRRRFEYLESIEQRDNEPL
jgi:hypothetical protein